MEKITIKKLAEELNLSTSTVSRALSDNYQISRVTKASIVKYAEQRGYRVNLFARSLREGKTRTIGLIVCSLDKAFMNQVLSAIYSYWHEKGYKLLVLQSGGECQAELNCITSLLDLGIDGLLISPSFPGGNFPYLNELISKGLPIVIFDRVDLRINTCQIASDNILAGEMAADYILSRKLNKILLIGGKDGFLSQERIKGFLTKMNSNGGTSHSPVYFDLEAPDMLFTDLFLFFSKGIQHSDFAAVFTTNDTLTLMVLRVFKKLGIQVPVIGFCNSELSDLLQGQPKTIVQPSSEIGQLASEKLYAAIKYRTVPEKEMLFLPATIIGRTFS